jgi:hypothetical protein
MTCPTCGRRLPILTPRLGVALAHLSPRVRLWLKHERRTRHVILNRHRAGACAA